MCCVMDQKPFPRKLIFLHGDFWHLFVCLGLGLSFKLLPNILGNDTNFFVRSTADMTPYVDSFVWSNIKIFFLSRILGANNAISSIQIHESPNKFAKKCSQKKKQGHIKTKQKKFEMILFLYVSHTFPQIPNEITGKLFIHRNASY